MQTKNRLLLTRRAALLGGAAALAAPGLSLVEAHAQDKKYTGSTVRFLASRNVHQTALGDKMGEIAKAWGIKFESRYVTTDQLEKKVVVDFVGGAETWDLVYTGGVQRMFDWADGGVIKEMTPFIKQHGDPKLLDWDGFTESARNAVTHGDKILGLAVATSDQTLAYRRDLFEHADEKAAFQAKFGYELRVPETYKQFRDVAEFFTRKKGGTLAGKTLDQDFYGTCFSNKKGTFLWHDYENILLAFGVDLYDPKTEKVGLTSPDSIAAAKYYHSLVPFQPTG
ncbi:MAG TPA: extracellular solute-binding protein, partial [Rubrobacteraceae bacterium]|nr:extracellular solute-binding protein [Rubrobacteraceae bacterium]